LILKKNTLRYSLFGIGFGFCFPILAILMDILVFKNLALGWQSVLEVHLANPLHFIIDTAPFFLGLAFGVAGKFLDKLAKVNQSLEKTIDTRTKELKYTNLDLLQSEEDLRESRQKLQAIIDSTSDANIFIGTDYKIVSFNKTAAKYAKIFYQRDLEIGNDLSNYIMPANLVDFKRIFEQTLSGEIMVREAPIHFPNNMVLWLSLEFHPVKNERKEIMGVSMNLADVTQRKTAELNLAAQNKELRQIAWMQSHEMRRLVANIIGLISLLEKEGLSPENQEIIFFLDKEIGALDVVIHKIVKSINETEV
jgi:PAS domain S-box-containing protein